MALFSSCLFCAIYLVHFKVLLLYIEDHHSTIPINKNLFTLLKAVAGITITEHYIIYYGVANYGKINKRPYQYLANFQATASRFSMVIDP